MPAPPLANTFEGGSNGVAISVANSGGASGDPFTAVVGTPAPSYSSAQAAHGTLGMSIVDATGSTGVEWGTLGTLTTDVYSRLYLYIGGTPVGNGPQFLKFYTAASANCCAFAISTGLKFLVYNAAVATVQTGTVNVPVGAWFRVETRVVASTTAGVAEWKWWSVPESGGAPTDTNTITGQAFGADVNLVRIGSQSVNPNTPFTQYIDDVAVSTSGWIGSSAPRVFSRASGLRVSV